MSEVKSFRLYLGEEGSGSCKNGGGFFKWLWTTGPEAKTSATKFFATIVSFTVIGFFICEGLGIGNIKVPSSADTLLAVFWLAYIGSNKTTSIVKAARKRTYRVPIPDDDIPETEE